MPWFVFVLSATAIILAGIRLAPYGEAIGKRTGIGQGWIGLLFLATLTSIPEMTTTVTGAMIDVPNIALGNAFGSNLFNVAIIVVLDVLLLGRGPFLLKVRTYHVLSGSVAILLTLLAALGMVIGSPLTWLGISPFSWLILFGYIAGVFILFHAEKRQVELEEEADVPMSLQKAILGFAICAIVVVAAGIFLIRSTKEISLATGLSASFMGAIVVAVVTSLPELATSIGALRIGAYDMIVGNLFGSNMFNILTIFFADAAFRSGSILAGLRGGESDQLIVAICGVLLAVIAMIAIGVRSRRKVFGVGIDSVFLGVAYLMATILIISRGI
ncbi:sodium:calcium antiporter [Candidatus Bipolaricaulota bacterium]|nr:sodium:calcium antiporter [Candidatus Bipolaricaulota bacterium]